MFAWTPRILFAALAVLGILGARGAIAQVTPGEVPSEVPGPTSPSLQSTPERPLGAIASQPGQLQSILLDILIGTNQGEIALGELARDKAQTPQVKQFAERMIDEHSNAVRQLQALQQAGAPQAPAQVPAARSSVPSNPAPMQQGADQVLTQQAAGQGGGMEGAMLDARLALVLKQFHDRMITLTRQDLSEQQGADFDRAYVFSQIGGHQAMLAMLETFRQYVTPDAQQVFQTATQMTQHHLADAKQIKQQLGAEVARQPGQEGPVR